MVFLLFEYAFHINEFTVAGGAVGAFAAFAVIKWYERKAERKASSKVEEAEKRAYLVLDSPEVKNLDEHVARQDLELPALFNLYSQQIAKYQIQTRFRANWSFVWAVISMLGGLTILLAGAWYVFNGGDVTHLIPSSAVTIVGAAISGFIAKTFLDVHQTSLNQLNHYFKQPVLNSHILNAQRLVQCLERGAQEEQYKKLIQAVLLLIPAEQAQSPVLNAAIAKRSGDIPESIPKQSGDGQQPVGAGRASPSEK